MSRLYWLDYFSNWQDTQQNGKSKKAKNVGVVPSTKASSSTRKDSTSSKEKQSKSLKSFDATRFVSWEDQQRVQVKSFRKVIVKKGVDRGSLIGKCQIWLTWRSCVASGKFFLNSCGSLCDLPEHEYLVCMVWGKEVNFAQEAIERTYNLPGFSDTTRDAYIRHTRN